MPIDEIASRFSPEETYFHVASTYTGLNRLRNVKVLELQRMGFSPASYISPHAYVDSTAQIGDHAFIFENNTIQPFVKIGSRVVLWSGNHIGHHSVIQDDVFVSSQVVISGHCAIGRWSFLGVNSTVGNNVSIGTDNWIQPGTVILQDTAADEMWRPEKPKKSSVVPTERFRRHQG